MGGHDLFQELVGDGSVDPDDDSVVGVHPLLVSVMQGVALLINMATSAELGEDGEHGAPPLGVVVGGEA